MANTMTQHVKFITKEGVHSQKGLQTTNQLRDTSHTMILFAEVSLYAYGKE